MSRPMQPLTSFIASFDDYEWKPQGKEMIVYYNEHSRFKIQVETGHPGKYFAVGCWRTEQLHEQGIHVDCDDAQEFADALVNTLFNHVSPFKQQHVVNALKKSLAMWEEERGSPSNPKDWCDCNHQ